MIDQLPLIRETLVEQARLQMRDYPQYQRADGWTDLAVATIIRHVRTALGDAFLVGDLTVVRRQTFPQIGETFPVGWSFRNRCWTAVRPSCYVEGLVSDVTIFPLPVVAALFREKPLPKAVVVGLLRSRRNALVREMGRLPEAVRTSAMFASLRGCPLCPSPKATPEERRAANRATRIMHAVGCLDRAIET